MGLDQRLTAQVALSLIPGLGGKTLARLLEHFGTLEAILAAGPDDLLAVPRIGPKLAAAIRAVDLDRTHAAITGWLAAGITILTPDDDEYPLLLKQVEDAPPVLYRRGSHRPEDHRAIALVGTRHPTADSRRLTETLAEKLAGQGWTVIAGLAAGIDTAAHRGALRAGGRTLAVLGCGVRVVYPPENTALAERIVQQGALLSEVHPDSTPNNSALVARNRLISGLSAAVIVIEAGASSGSLHAARFAQTQGRAVMAVDNGRAGNQNLIASGAHGLPPDDTAWDTLLENMKIL